MAARSAWPAPTSCRVSSVQIGRHRSSSREPAIASACAIACRCGAPGPMPCAAAPSSKASKPAALSACASRLACSIAYAR